MMSLPHRNGGSEWDQFSLVEKAGLAKFQVKFNFNDAQNQ